MTTHRLPRSNRILPVEEIVSRERVDRLFQGTAVLRRLLWEWVVEVQAARFQRST